MKHVLFVLATLVGLCGLSPAQEPQTFQEHFDRGIAALTAGKHEEGIDAFKTCLELQPQNPTCAYNIACGYSLKNELDAAFEWLGKAAEWGFGSSQANVEMVEKTDKDLANMRADPRFAPLLEGMRKRLAELTAAAEKEWKNPIVILPEGHEGMDKVGALVVLHDTGKTKDSVAGSYWKEIAAELGLALVVPSGKVVAGPTAEAGMSWFGNFDEFTRRYWVAEESIQPALDALKKLKPMDATRTILVGEGQGGIVAFNAAMRAPRLYAGVLTLDAPILTNLTSSYIPAAVSAGVRVRVLVNNEEMFGLPKEQIATFTGQMRTGLRTSKLDHELTNYTPNAEQPGQRRALCTEKLRALLPVQSPAEGQTEGKPVEAGTGGK